MPELSDFEWDHKSESWHLRHRLSNGQFCQVAFYRWRRLNDTYYYVAFAVADKKKSLNGWFANDKNNNIEYKTTGKCGAEALLWCRDRMLDFEREVRRSRSGDTKLVVKGTDRRRSRLYERALVRYGYRKTRLDGEWAMVKSLGRLTEDDAND